MQKVVKYILTKNKLLVSHYVLL